MARIHGAMAPEEPYEALIRRFEQPVFNLVSRLLDDPSDAAHVVQKVFLAAFRNGAALPGESTPKTWIYRIAVSQAGHYRRWSGWRWRRRVNLQRTLLEDALSAVNPKFRAPLLLREIEGLSYQEISEILNVSPATVKSRIQQGRDALQLRLRGPQPPGLKSKAPVF